MAERSVGGGNAREDRERGSDARRLMPYAATGQLQVSADVVSRWGSG
jgi:hypothetical protein